MHDGKIETYSTHSTDSIFFIHSVIIYLYRIRDENEQSSCIYIHFANIYHNKYIYILKVKYTCNQGGISMKVAALYFVRRSLHIGERGVSL
jgi:hypothetical protein